jgi:periplasmic copper chaperone A
VRWPWPAIAGGVVVVAVGAAGLIRGAMPQTAAASSGTVNSSEPLVVTGAYVRPPVPPNTTAAAYFTVYNTTSRPDRLLSVETGAGGSAVLHAVNQDGSMTVTPNGVVIPAHGSYTLSVGKGHVMIGQLYGKLKAGESVDLELDFTDASLDITAPVIAVGAPAPTGPAAPAENAHDHSGAHS